MTGLSGYKLEVSSDLECFFANKASVYLIDLPYSHTGPTAIAQESLHGRLQNHDTKQKSPWFHVRDMKLSLLSTFPTDSRDAFWSRHN